MTSPTAPWSTSSRASKSPTGRCTRCTRRAPRRPPGSGCSSTSCPSGSASRPPPSKHRPAGQARRGQVRLRPPRLLRTCNYGFGLLLIGASMLPAKVERARKRVPSCDGGFCHRARSRGVVPPGDRSRLPMTVMRVERVVYGVPNLDECVRFFADFGLEPLDGGGSGARFGTQTGQVIELREQRRRQPAVRGAARAEPARDRLGGRRPGIARQARDEPAVRPVPSTPTPTAWRTPWDETGFGVGLAVSQPVTGLDEYPGSNRTGNINRWNEPMTHPGRVQPLRLCHVALDIVKAGQGGRRSPSTPSGSASCRPTGSPRSACSCGPRATPTTTRCCCATGRTRTGSTTARFEVARVDEVIVGANDMIEKGWHEARRLGRQPRRVEHLPVHSRAVRRAGRVRRRHGPGGRELRPANDHEETPPHTIWTLRLERES